MGARSAGAAGRGGRICARSMVPCTNASPVGRLDGSRSPFDQLAEIVDAVGDRIDVICDGGIQRGTHVLKALSVGAKACSGGRWYLYALAGGGEAGVKRALTNMKAELIRDMKLMGVTSVRDLGRHNLRYR